MKTQLDVIRGLATPEELAPDAPPCLPWDLLDVAEVATLRRCRPKTVYDWRRQGRLSGPEGSPVMFYGWSVLRLLGPTQEPITPAEELEKPRFRGKPRQKKYSSKALDALFRPFPDMPYPGGNRGGANR